MDLIIKESLPYGNFVMLDAYGTGDQIKDYQATYFAQYNPLGYMTSVDFCNKLEDGTYHLRITRLASCD